VELMLGYKLSDNTCQISIVSR